MQKQFWRDKWHTNDIGFDQAAVNPLLEKHFSSLSLAPDSRVFVPLCGKSIDMAWLLKQGIHLVGVELSQDAVEQFFATLSVQPEISQADEFIRYAATNIDLYVGDYFALNANHLGKVAAVYDRAALVALPHEMRVDYSQHLIKITDQAPQLLITFDYNQTLQSGPPFAISHDEVKQHYVNDYQLSLLASVTVIGGLKGGCDAEEQIWLLQ